MWASIKKGCCNRDLKPRYERPLGKPAAFHIAWRNILIGALLIIEASEYKFIANFAFCRGAYLNARLT